MFTVSLCLRLTTGTLVLLSFGSRLKTLVLFLVMYLAEVLTLAGFWGWLVTFPGRLGLWSRRSSSVSLTDVLGLPVVIL